MPVFSPCTWKGVPWRWADLPGPVTRREPSGVSLKGVLLTLAYVKVVHFSGSVLMVSLESLLTVGKTIAS